jgi:chemotaxis protein methyltransferase CheR
MLQSALATPTFGSLCVTQVTDGELRQFAELIYRRTGICISPEKKLLLSNRLRRRLRRTGIAEFGDYYRHLRRLRNNDPEWDALLQEITTHETYLFRDEAQWKWFREVFLSQCAAAARKGQTPHALRIWSAACSTGDEPVTAACCIAGRLPDTTHWQIDVLGTDLAVGALEQARAAAFGERAMRLVPAEYRRRFFVELPDGRTWQARPVLTEMIAFRQHNLIEPLCERPFDLVLLKNVLIYFDAASKTTVLQHVRAALRPGGLLVVGATENVAGMLRDFERLEPWLFRKPPSKRAGGDFRKPALQRTSDRS